MTVVQFGDDPMMPEEDDIIVAKRLRASWL